MKTLIINELEKKIGNTELMIGTDVLKIPLAMVLFLTSMHKCTKNYKVGHSYSGKRSGMGYERSE